jgi:hypothetical protein
VKVKFVLALGAVLAITAAIGVASGAIPSSDGKINACQAKVHGFRYVRLLDSGESCKGSEQPLSWNQKGPKGDRGPQGPKGDPAPAGGFSHIVQRGAFGTAAPGVSGVRVSCQPGEIAISGGYDLLDERPDVIVDALTPTSPSDTEWGVKVLNNSGAPRGIDLKVLCAS